LKLYFLLYPLTPTPATHPHAFASNDLWVNSNQEHKTANQTVDTMDASLLVEDHFPLEETS
jgi:hypothetical protein